MDLQEGQMEEPPFPQEGGGAIPHPAGDFELPSQEKLLEMLEKLNMSDEDKQEIREGLLKNVVNRLQGENVGMQSSRILIVAACVLTLISLFVFFGYKLYRSQTEKERKREEKKKQKQQKKKHKS